MSIKQQIVITAVVLLLSIVFFGVSSFDIMIQNHLFNSKTQTWLLNRDLEPYHFLFYSGIKKLLLIIGASLLIILFFFRQNRHIKPYTKGLIIVLLSAILVPSIVGTLKKTTNMPCPKDEMIYGGLYPRTAVWEHYAPRYQHKEKIACWPAGHASGGFALMSLFFLFKRKRNRYLGLLLGLVTGWSMGNYKMLIGDHFFSHTWITMLLAWLTILSVTYTVDRIVESRKET